MKRKGIRKKVTTAVTALVSISLSLLGSVLAIMIFESQKKEILAIENEVLNYAVNEIFWDSHEIETLLSITTSNFDLLKLDSKKQLNSLSQILSHHDIKQHNILEELILLSNAGDELAKVSRTEVYNSHDLGNWSNSPEFIIPSGTGEVYYGNIFFNEETREPRITISMPFVNIRTGEVRGFLLGKIRLHRIWENVVERSFGESGQVFITNSGGKVVAHPDPSVVYQNTVFTSDGSSGLQTGLNGTKVLMKSRPFYVGSEPFAVHASMPFSEVLNLSLNTLLATIVFVIIFIALSIVVTSFAVQRIVRPIESLADTARNISLGKLSPAVKLGNADEIGELSSAFNVMTAKLIETISSLKQEVSERKLAQDQIRSQNKFLNEILNSLTHPFYVINAKDYTIKMANPAANFEGMTKSSTCYALTHNRDEPCKDSEHPCVLEKIKETGQPVTVEHVHYDKAGNPSIYEIHGYPVFDNRGEISQVIEYNLDISDRKLMEEALQLSEQKNRSITSTAQDAMIIMNDSGCITFWNPAAEKIFGYSEADVMNKQLHTLISPARFKTDYDDGISNFAVSGKGPYIGKTIEMTATKKDGSEFPVELSLSSLKVQDRWNAIGIVRDITARKQSEEKIIESLRDKELLLREIHHRVKNNMQVISSLLGLQSKHMKNEEDVLMLKDSQNRIKSMALVHEKLYKSEDISNIDLSDYIKDLTKSIFRFFETATYRVSFEIDAEDVWLSIDNAIPCGLIINELITNSLKHAFPGDRKGTVLVSLKKNVDGTITLRVSDDGVGMPGDMDFRKVESLGLNMLVTLAEGQLQGTVELDRTKGTGFTVKFKEIPYKKRY